jgi:predicted neuraminidase
MTARYSRFSVAAGQTTSTKAAPNGGRSWSAPVATALHNNNSSIQARLANGHLALVFNDCNAEAATARRTSLYDEIEDDGAAPTDSATEPTLANREAFWGAPRAPMTVAISPDGGRGWVKRDVETGDGYWTNNSRDGSNRELSYPSIKQTPDGAIHVAYTHFHQAIRYVRFDEEWVLSAAGN